MTAATCPRCGLAGSPGSRCARCGADLPIGKPADRHTQPGATTDLVLTGRTPGIDGVRWVIAKDSTTIGRDPSADLVLAFPSVSRTHSRIIRGPTGFFLEDAGGANGTFVGERRVDGRVELADGDRIRLAEYELIVSIARPEGRATLTMPTVEEPMSTTVVAIGRALEVGDAVAAEIAEEEEVDATIAAVVIDAATDPEPAEIVTQEMDLSAAPWSVEEITEGQPTVAIAGGTSLDALAASAADFGDRFDIILAALRRFNERYAELGGRDAALNVAGQAILIAEQPETVSALLAFGQHARAIQLLALAALELGDAINDQGTTQSASQDE